MGITPSPAVVTVTLLAPRAQIKVNDQVVFDVTLHDPTCPSYSWSTKASPHASSFSQEVKALGAFLADTLFASITSKEVIFPEDKRFYSRPRHLSLEVVDNKLETFDYSLPLAQVLTKLWSKSDSYTPVMPREAMTALFTSYGDVYPLETLRRLWDWNNLAWGDAYYSHMTHLAPTDQARKAEGPFKEAVLKFITAIYGDVPQEEVVGKLTPLPVPYDEKERFSYKAQDDPSFLQLPLKTKKVQKYLQEVTVADLRLLNGKLVANSGAAESITLANLLLEEAKAPQEEQGQALAHAVYNNFFSKFGPYCTRNELVSVHQSLVFGDDQGQVLKILNSFLAELPSHEEGKKLYKSLQDLTLGGRVMSWVQGGRNSSMLITLLAGAIKSPEQLLNTLEGVARSKKPLTPNQWTEYVNHYDDYEGLPPDLWLSIIRKVQE